MERRVNEKGKADLHNYQRKLDRALEKLNKSKTTARNKELILSFLTDNDKRFSVPRKEVYASRLRFLAEWITPHSFDDISREDLERAVRANILKDPKKKEVTKTLYLKQIRTFYRWINDPEALAKQRSDPVVIKWIVRELSESTEPEMDGLGDAYRLTEEDILKMVDAVDHPRTKAIIACLGDTGARIGEFLDMRLEHIMPDRAGCIVKVPVGKTVSRTVRLKWAAPYVTEWKNIHPHRENPAAMFWAPINSGKRGRDGRKDIPGPNELISYQNLNKILKRAALNAGVHKPVNAQRFRKAAVTIDELRGMPDRLIKMKFGWSGNSKQPARYSQALGKDLCEWELREQGLGLEETKKEPIKAIRCRRCGEINKPTSDYCSKCSLPLNSKAALMIDMQQDVEDNEIDIILKDPDGRALIKEAYNLLRAKGKLK
jgi:integrase/recombinase XerD